MAFDYAHDTVGSVIREMDGQSASKMSQIYHALVVDTVARLEREERARGVIFASAKKTFFAAHPAYWPRQG